jgi:hypothetical protein
MTLIAVGGFGARFSDTWEKRIAQGLWTGREKPGREAGYEKVL